MCTRDVQTYITVVLIQSLPIVIYIEEIPKYLK